MREVLISCNFEATAAASFDELYTRGENNAMIENLRGTDHADYQNGKN